MKLLQDQTLREMVGRQTRVACKKKRTSNAPGYIQIYADMDLSANKSDK